MQSCERVMPCCSVLFRSSFSVFLFPFSFLFFLFFFFLFSLVDLVAGLYAAWAEVNDSGCGGWCARYTEWVEQVICVG